VSCVGCCFFLISSWHALGCAISGSNPVAVMPLGHPACNDSFY